MQLWISTVCTLAVLNQATGAIHHQRGSVAAVEMPGPGGAWPFSSAGLSQLLDAGVVTLPFVLVPAGDGGRAKRAGASSHYASYPSRFRGQQYKVCQPSKDQIVEFLRALHLARSGKTDQLATLCNDSQSVADIETNIRFIG